MCRRELRGKHFLYLRGWFLGWHGINNRAPLKSARCSNNFSHMLIKDGPTIINVFIDFVSISFEMIPLIVYLPTRFSIGLPFWVIDRGSFGDGAGQVACQVVVSWRGVCWWTFREMHSQLPLPRVRHQNIGGRLTWCGDSLGWVWDPGYPLGYPVGYPLVCSQRTTQDAPKSALY